MGPFAPIPAMPAMPSLTDFAGPAAANNQPSDSANAKSFASVLSDAFDNLNSLQVNGDAQATAYANHQTSDLQSVMEASEQASISMQLATQVRNKVTDAYQNIMQMQV